MSDILEQSHIHDMDIDICRECIVYTMYNQTECVYVYIIVYIYRLLSPLRTIYIDSNPMVCGGQAIIASINDIEKFKSIRYETCTWCENFITTADDTWTVDDAHILRHFFVTKNRWKLHQVRASTVPRVGSMLYIHLSASVYKSSIYSHIFYDIWLNAIFQPEAGSS